MRTPLPCGAVWKLWPGHFTTHKVPDVRRIAIVAPFAIPLGPCFAARRPCTMQLFSSLYVQDTICRHVVALEQWCDAHPAPQRAAHPVLSPAWITMRNNPLLFRNWCPGTTPQALIRLPWNLYNNPVRAGKQGPSCTRSRLQLFYFALAETRRLMGTMPPFVNGGMHSAQAPPELETVAHMSMECATQGISDDEWRDYRHEVGLRFPDKPWVDIDTVAAVFCGVAHMAPDWSMYTRRTMHHA